MQYGLWLLWFYMPCAVLAMDYAETMLPGTENDEVYVISPIQELQMSADEQKDGARQALVYAASRHNVAVEDELSIELGYALDMLPLVHRTKRQFVRKPPRNIEAQEQARREFATKKAIENHLAGGVIFYGHEGKSLIKNGFIQLPYPIRRLPVPVCQPVVIKQEETGTCGSRSVANALALQDLIKKEMPLTSQNIQMMAQKYEKLHVQQGMTSREQINLARKFNVPHMYVMAILPMDPLDMSKANKYPFTVIESVDRNVVNLYHETEVLEAIVQNIRSQKNIIAHFLCHLEGKTSRQGHAVVLSIIKNAGQAQIVYMDSNNLPIAEHSQAAAYITYLYWQCIA